MSEVNTPTQVPPIVIVEDDFMTDPLSGLCPLPAHAMTHEQMRNHVTLVRQMRQSAQVFKVETEQHEKVKVAKVKSAPKKVDISDLENLF